MKGQWWKAIFSETIQAVVFQREGRRATNDKQKSFKDGPKVELTGEAVRSEYEVIL